MRTAQYKFRAAIAVFVLLVSTPLLAGDETTNPPAVDPCKTAKPALGCYMIITPPRPLKLARPAYPHGWKKKRGQVHLKTTITATGELRDLQVLSGPGDLKQASLDAVRQWHYRPSTVNGIPVEVQHDILVDFTKKDGVLLGPDEVSPDLPMEPPKDLTALFHIKDVQRVGNGVKAPRAVFTPDPSYSELAKRNRYQGKCLLGLLVTPEGKPKDIWVIRPLGEGLDERAVETIATWKFDPAIKEGQPVAVLINVEVQFRLY